MLRVLRIAAFLGLLPAAQAQTTIGDWIFNKDADGVPFIATLNDSDGALGKWCDGERETCVWMMASQTRCENGIRLPALINSSSGSASVNMVCIGPRQIGRSILYRLVITEFDVMTRLIKESYGRIGIAVATEGDGFRVNRFSLSGGSSALSRMDAAEIEYLRVKQKTTRDQRL